MIAPFTPEELADLEAKARAATPGPWNGGHRCDGAIRAGDSGARSSLAEVYACADAAHIAANAPDVTLRFVAAVRRLTARAEAAEKERDELRAQVNDMIALGLRTQVEAHEATARAEAAEKAIREIVNEADDRGRQHTAAFMENDDLDAARGHACAAAACAHIVEDAARRAARLLPAEPDHG